MVDLDELERKNNGRSGTLWGDAKDLIAEVRALRAVLPILARALAEAEERNRAIEEARKQCSGLKTDPAE